MSIEPQSGGGGWMSGPSISVPHRDLPDVEPQRPVHLDSTLGPDEAATGRHASDDRPTYPVAKLILAVQRVLAEAGIPVTEDRNMLYTASIAGCDLLRALGVIPINAEARERRS